MSRLIAVFSCLFLTLPYFLGQNHVQWTFEYDKNQQSLIFKGKIDKHWHLYSQRTPKYAGPVPVSINLEKNKNFKIKGKSVEISAPIELYDNNFESKVFIFENDFESHLKVRPKKNRSVTFEGVITYMVCNDSQCLPPIDKKFKIEFP